MEQKNKAKNNKPFPDPDIFEGLYIETTNWNYHVHHYCPIYFN